MKINKNDCIKTKIKPNGRRKFKHLDPTELIINQPKIYKKIIKLLGVLVLLINN